MGINFYTFSFIVISTSVKNSRTLFLTKVQTKFRGMLSKFGKTIIHPFLIFPKSIDWITDHNLNVSKSLKKLASYVKRNVMSLRNMRKIIDWA